MKSKISFKEINRLAIPAIFAGIVEPLISLTDTAVAGRLAENADEALGAIGLVGAFMSALIWIFLQTSSAISALVSHGVGEGRVNRLKPLVSQLLYFNVLVSLVLSVFGFFYAEEIFILYGASKDLLAASVEYFQIRVWGFPLTLCTFTIFGVFNGFQNTSWGMRIAITGGVLNVGLDLFLVFVLDYDLAGIAWASLASQGLMFILALVYMYRKTPFRLNYIIPNHPDFSKTLSMSLDLFIRTLSLNIAMFLAIRFATMLGADNENQYVGAHTLLIQIWLLSSFLLDGYAHAGSALSGKLFGKRDFSALKGLVVDLIKVMLILGVTLMVIYLTFYYQIGLFLTKSENILDVFYGAFWIVALMQPINSIAFLFDGIYKGLGETKLLRNVFVLALVLGFIPAIFLFRYLELGLLGIWYSFVIWMCIRAAGLIIHFYKHYYKG